MMNLDDPINLLGIVVLTLALAAIYYGVSVEVKRLTRHRHRWSFRRFRYKTCQGAHRLSRLVWQVTPLVWRLITLASFVAFLFVVAGPFLLRHYLWLSRIPSTLMGLPVWFLIARNSRKTGKVPPGKQP